MFAKTLILTLVLALNAFSADILAGEVIFDEGFVLIAMLADADSGERFYTPGMVPPQAGWPITGANCDACSAGAELNFNGSYWNFLGGGMVGAEHYYELPLQGGLFLEGQTTIPDTEEDHLEILTPLRYSMNFEGCSNYMAFVSGPCDPLFSLQDSGTAMAITEMVRGIDGYYYVDRVTVTLSAPEPHSWCLIGVGLVLLLAGMKRRPPRRAQNHNTPALRGVTNLKSP